MFPGLRRGSLWVGDPTRINDHDVRRKPVIVVVNGVVDPIAVVVDVRLRHLHAGKDQTGRRLGQFLARLYFLHLHASGAYADDLAIIDFCEDVSLADRVDLMFAVLLDLFAKQSVPIEVLFRPVRSSIAASQNRNLSTRWWNGASVDVCLWYVTDFVSRHFAARLRRLLALAFDVCLVSDTPAYRSSLQHCR